MGCGLDNLFQEIDPHLFALTNVALRKRIFEVGHTKYKTEKEAFAALLSIAIVFEKLGGNAQSPTIAAIFREKLNSFNFAVVSYDSLLDKDQARDIEELAKKALAPQEGAADVERAERSLKIMQAILERNLPSNVVESVAKKRPPIPISPPTSRKKPATEKSSEKKHPKQQPAAAAQPKIVRKRAHEDISPGEGNVETLRELIVARYDMNDPEQKLTRMENLLIALDHDLQEDISEATNEEFTKRIELQFRCFEEITTLRSSLKQDSLSEALEQKRMHCTQMYKQFIQKIPSFRAAATIKGELPRQIKSFHDVPYYLRAVKLPLFEDAEELSQLRIQYKHTVQATLPGKERAKGNWKKRWGNVQKTLLAGYQRARPLLAQGRQLSWVTGTSTATLVPLLRMQAGEIGSPALIPSGQLINYGIVPLTGELFWGISPRGINQRALSGCEFPHVMGAKSYADTMQTQGIFKCEDELEIIKAYSATIGQSTPFPLPLARVQIAIMRLVFAQSQETQGAKEAVKLARKLLVELKEKSPEIPDSLIAAIDEPTKYGKMTNEDAHFVREPTGLIFGSFVLQGDLLTTVYSDIKFEMAAIGPQKLGKDIQVVFVEESNLTQVREYLKQLPPESRIHVVSMKALNYLTATWVKDVE